MVGAASAAPAVIQQRDMSANDVVGAIGEITVLSASLNVTVSKIEFSSLAIITPSTFTTVTTGFQGIITAVSNDITAIGKNPIADLTVDVDGQNAICSALTTTVIGKKGLLTSLGGGPIAAVLRTLEGVVDTIAFQIIAAVPGCAEGAKADIASLKVTIQEAECAYVPLGTVIPGLICPVANILGGLSL
ncbi:uvi-1 protein [Rutstroemia sp. NJR-2017a WRK4]|nr:uvi-1 protein [Rutstroemia sp. NJR-2017a WRK4]